MSHFLRSVPHRDSLLVVDGSASNAVGRGFAPRPGHTKDHHENGTNCLMTRRGLEFGSATRQCKRLGSVWNCLWRHAL